MKLILFWVGVEVVERDESSYSWERNNTWCDKVPGLAV